MTVPFEVEATVTAGPLTGHRMVVTRDETSTCRACGGPIYRHAWGSGQGWGAWMHVTPDHRAEPAPAEPAPAIGADLLRDRAAS